jgi:hypothetical protein
MSISARGYYSIKGEGTSTHTKKASFSDDFFVIVLTSIYVRTYQMVFTLDVHRANTLIWKKSNDEPAKYVVAHSVLISKLGEIQYAQGGLGCMYVWVFLREIKSPVGDSDMLLSLLHDDDVLRVALGRFTKDNARGRRQTRTWIERGRFM